MLLVFGDGVMTVQLLGSMAHVSGVEGMVPSSSSSAIELGTVRHYRWSPS